MTIIRRLALISLPNSRHKLMHLVLLSIRVVHSPKHQDGDFRVTPDVQQREATSLFFTRLVGTAAL